MIARLRSMVVGGDRTILVLDRCGRMTDEHGKAVGDQLQRMAERIGLLGGVVFSDEIELPDDEPSEGMTIYPDEIASLRRAIGELEGTDATQGHAHTLRLLLQRAER